MTERKGVTVPIAKIELRRRLTWPGDAMTPRPVHLNTWEALYFDHRLGRL